MVLFLSLLVLHIGAKMITVLLRCQFIPVTCGIVFAQIIAWKLESGHDF